MPRGIKEHIFFYLAKTAAFCAKKWPEHFLASNNEELDLYASSMAENFNKLHKAVFTPFYNKIQVENIEVLKNLPKDGCIIYAAKDIGQLEYNFFNYLFLNENIPLAKFANELSIWQWLPLKTIKYILVKRAEHFLANGHLPPPTVSGHLRGLIENKKAILLRLKSTPIFDDLFWYTAESDPLLVAIDAYQKNDLPIYFIPLHFIWDKRPDERHLLGLLPSGIRKLITFWLNYKKRAVVRIGEPLQISSAIDQTKKLEEQSRGLRHKLLNILQQEKKAVTGPAIKPRSWMIERTLEDDAVQKTIYEVAHEKKSAVEDLKTLTSNYADEIAADINYSYLEAAQSLTKWFLKSRYEDILINSDGLEKLKKALVSAPVILVPNHKSHLDYLLITTLLYENNVAIPHIAAGINLSFWPLGHIFRRCGAFFLRRSFGGNKLYSAVFKSYLRTLLQEGYCQEFFIEGTRSRTGKLLRPRLGLLSMLMELIREGAAEKAFFVPVSITYDHLLEEYKGELKGETKKSERKRDLLRIGKHFKQKHGRIYLRFGEPIPYSNEDVDLNPQKLAGNIMVSINREVVVTPEAVTASALLISEKPGITHEEIMSNAKELIKYLKWKGAIFADSLNEGTEQTVNEAINKFIARKFIEPHKEFEPVCYEIKAERRIELDYYKNTIIHFFVSAGCIATILSSFIKKGILQADFNRIREKYLFCKELFAREFAFSTRLDVDEHIHKILSWFEAEGIRTSLDKLWIYRSLLKNFFEANLLTILACKRFSPTDEKTAIRTITKFGRHLLLLSRITRPEAISAPLIKNAMSNAKLQQELEELI